MEFQFILWIENWNNTFFFGKKGNSPAMFGYEIHCFGHGYALSHEPLIEDLTQSHTLTTNPSV